MKNRLRNVKKNNEKYRDQLRDAKKREKELKNKVDQLETDKAELERKLRELAESKKAKPPKIPDYSVEKNTLELSGRKHTDIRGNRRPKHQRELEVDRDEHEYPEGVKPEDCFVSRTRIITRIENGKKLVIRVYIYREKTAWGKNGKEGRVKGVVSRSEYGIEVAIIAAYLIEELELSYSQTQKVFSFFCDLEIESSQINNLLNQLQKEWGKAFEAIKDLMVLSAIVHLDETGWKVGKKRCYTWLFATITHTVILYGRNRSEEILDEILPRSLFRGLGISDCYRMYLDRFDKAQKCWAHFLRKIIKLYLLYPEKKEYAQFFEYLIKTFSVAKRLKEDSKIPENQKTQAVEALKSQIELLCTRKEEGMNKNTPKDHREFVNLQKSLIRNIEDLFTFVLHEGVEPTNNYAEQSLRKTARSRNNYQTSKTDRGAERRSVLSSVLDSLRKNMSNFSLDGLIAEINLWMEEGISLFEKQLAATRA